MQIQNIPEELQRRNQWVVWKVVIRDGKATKPPFNPRDPNQTAKVDNPDTWASFGDAVLCVQNNPSIFGGIGFVFTEEDDYFGIDIDDEQKVKPEFKDERVQVVSRILEQINSYTEISPSGKGLHILARGRSPVVGVEGRRDSRIGLEVYCAKRFFTFTGNVYNGRGVITDQQDFLNEAFNGAVAIEDLEKLENSAYMRAIDLSDDEVLQRACHYNPKFLDSYTGQMECGPGEWSSTFMRIIGILDNVSGNIEQVRRLVMQSPMVLNSPPGANNETRQSKARRIFDNALRMTRTNNSAFKRSVEHGRQILEDMERFKQERAERELERFRLQEAEAERLVGRLSAGAASLLDAFPQLTNEHKVLTRPPGIIGRFVEATENGSYRPFTKFAIPVTFATLAGIVGRKYKLPDRSGMNLNFILAAPSNAGKTLVMRSWERMLNEAKDVIQSVGNPERSRIINSSTSSIQAIMEKFMEVPSCVWFIEECHSQLVAMSNCRTPVEAQLRDGYNQLYDAAVHGHLFSGPLSRTNTKQGVTAINNLSASTFWTTTASKFDIFTGDALDGFMSRVIVIRHSEPGGDPVQFIRAPDPQLVEMLSQLLQMAKNLDETYLVDEKGARDLLVSVDTSQVQDLSWEFFQVVNKIANAAILGNLPPVYGAVSRVPILALRMAGVMAVVENPYAPSITIEQYKWSFGYILQNVLSLLSDMDKGELGETASDETLVVVRAMKVLLKKKEYKAGVPKRILHNRIRGCRPFIDPKPGGSSASIRASAIITHMISEGMFTEVFSISGTPGPNATILAPSDHPIWG